MKDCSGALFLSRFFRDKKKRERKARPEVFTEGHALILSFIVLELSEKFKPLYIKNPKWYKTKKTI